MSTRVLVVDPDTAVAASTARALAHAGYVAMVVDSFESATRQIDTDLPALVITAVRLGWYNGLHLVLRCRDRHPGLPVIVTDGKDDANLAAEAAQYGARFLAAPDFSALLAAVQTLAPSLRGEGFGVALAPSA